MKQILLMIAVVALVGCGSPQGTPSSNTNAPSNKVLKSFFNDNAVKPAIDGGLMYRHFKTVTFGDKFKGISHTFLSSPTISFEYNYANGGSGFGTPQFDFGDPLSKYPITDMPKFSEPDFTVDVKNNRGKIAFQYHRSGFSERSFYPSSQGVISIFSIIQFRTFKSTPEISNLVIGSPYPLFFDSVSEIRDENRNDYTIEIISKDDAPTVYDVQFLTDQVLLHARNGSPVILKVYGRMGGNNRSFIVSIPNWYIKAYVFAMMKRDWITKKKAGEKLANEFEKLEALPDLTLRDFHGNSK